MLRAEDLAKENAERSKMNHETYKLILAQCYECIHRSNVRVQRHMQFAVPDRVGGRPPFKQSHALQYVFAKLRKGGFHVLHVLPHGNVLYISWLHTLLPQGAAKSGPKIQKKPTGKCK